MEFTYWVTQTAPKQVSGPGPSLCRPNQLDKTPSQWVLQSNPYLSLGSNHVLI